MSNNAERTGVSEEVEGADETPLTPFLTHALQSTLYYRAEYRKWKIRGSGVHGIGSRSAV